VGRRMTLLSACLLLVWTPEIHQHIPIVKGVTLPKASDDLLEEIAERLDQILRVLSLQVASERSITEGARALKLAGLDNQTIAEILNTSPGTVRTLTANLRVRRRR
jgi:DNA-binding NarL/FixJ family response regulator